MNSKAIDRALYGPSIYEVTIGALLSIGLGFVLAMVFLILKPVSVVKEPPKEDERIQGEVYFVEGRIDATRGRQWIRKRQMLTDGTPGEVALSEEELNAWLSAGNPAKPAEKKPAPKPVAPAKAPAGKAGAPPPPPAQSEVPDELLTIETPNVRIRDSVFQVGVPGSLNLISLSFPVVVQARGTFEKVDDVWVFKPSELYFGSMPLHRIPGTTDLVSKKLMKSGIVPDDVLNAWKRVAHVAIDDKLLKLTVQ